MDKVKSNKKWIAVMIVCGIIAICCAAALIWIKWDSNRRSIPEENVTSRSQDTNNSSDLINDIDFDHLESVNKDIYAWLKIPGTGQEYPVLQHDRDVDYYLRKDIYGDYYIGGSLYTQFVFNNKEFDDPCTVIFGHDMNSGAMFGSLQPLTESLDLDDESDESNYFYIYTREKVQKYRIACAGTYNDKNVLYYYDFNKREDFDAFFEEFNSFPIGIHNISSNFSPEYGEKMCILATCFKNDYNYRYLTVGVLIEEPLN